MYTVRVMTGDLLHDCPIKRHKEDSPGFPWSRYYNLRRRWSHSVVEVAAPVGIAGLPNIGIDDQWQLLAYHLCRSRSFWRVVGPPALMDELATLPTAVWGRYCANLYLCQHEIPGD
jgi:hypothetical protein